MGRPCKAAGWICEVPCMGTRAKSGWEADALLVGSVTGDDTVEQ